MLVRYGRVSHLPEQQIRLMSAEQVVVALGAYFKEKAANITGSEHVFTMNH